MISNDFLEKSWTWQRCNRAVSTFLYDFQLHFQPSFSITKKSIHRYLWIRPGPMDPRDLRDCLRLVYPSSTHPLPFPTHPLLPHLIPQLGQTWYAVVPGLRVLPQEFTRFQGHAGDSPNSFFEARRESLQNEKCQAQRARF